MQNSQPPYHTKKRVKFYFSGFHGTWRGLPAMQECKYGFVYARLEVFVGGRLVGCICACKHACVCAWVNYDFLSIVHNIYSAHNVITKVTLVIRNFEGLHKPKQICSSDNNRNFKHVCWVRRWMKEQLGGWVHEWMSEQVSVHGDKCE